MGIFLMMNSEGLCANECFIFIFYTGITLVNVVNLLQTDTDDDDKVT